MGIPHGHLRIAVTQNLLHLIKAAAARNQEAGKGMPQVVDAQMREACQLAYAIPSMGYRGIGFTVRIREHHLELVPSEGADAGEEGAAKVKFSGVKRFLREWKGTIML